MRIAMYCTMDGEKAKVGVRCGKERVLIDFFLEGDAVSLARRRRRELVRPVDLTRRHFALVSALRDFVSVLLARHAGTKEETAR